MSEQDVLNAVTQMLEAAPDSSKPSDFPVSLPANNVPELCQKLAVLVSTGKTKEALGVQLSQEQVKCLTDLHWLGCEKKPSTKTLLLTPAAMP